MFGIFKKKTKIQSIAQEVPSVLLRSFGDKNTYVPDEIDQALQELGYDKQKRSKSSLLRVWHVRKRIMLRATRPNR